MSLPSDATSSGVYSLHGSTRRSALSVNASPDFTVVRFDTDLDRSTWPQPARVKAHSRATAAVVTRRDTRCTVATPPTARAPNSYFASSGTLTGRSHAHTVKNPASTSMPTPTHRLTLKPPVFTRSASVSKPI